MNDKIKALPNTEKSELLASIDALARTAPLLARSLKEVTDALIDAGYEKDDALRLTAYLFRGNK